MPVIASSLECTLFLQSEMQEVGLFHAFVSGKKITSLIWEKKNEQVKEFPVQIIFNLRGQREQVKEVPI